MLSDSDRPLERTPFRLHEPVDLTPLRRRLEEAGYTETAISRLLLEGHSGKALDLASAMRRTAGADPFHTLVRLFVLARTMPEGAIRAAIAPAKVEDLVAVGLLVPSPEGIRSIASIMPLDDLMLVREFWPSFAGQAKARDFVAGLGSSSRTVGYLTVRRQGDLALDLGTGTGYLALLAGRHAERVIATDVNPRALSFAALNCRLNGVNNVEFRLGGLFEPVAECRFDAIMSNPPFVISPKANFEYRDSGLEGDTLCEQLVRQAPGMLREGGYSTALFNWYHRDDDDWAERPTAWLAGSGCDAWLTCFETTDPIGYAALWLSEEDVHDRGRDARMMDDWMAYFERLGAGRISLGAAIVRRRASGPNWLRVERGPTGEPTQPCSAQILRIFAAEDLLQAAGPEASLLDRAFVLTPDHQLEQVLRAENHRWVVQSAQLRQTQGYPFIGNVDRLVSTLLAGCDGQHQLGHLVADLAQSLGADATQVAPACSQVIRTLLRWGFLTAL